MHAQNRPPYGTASWRVAQHLPDEWFATPRYELVDLGYETPCWRWLMSLSSTGYAQISAKVAGRQYTSVAHRVMYEREHGRLSAHLQLDHLCRNRPCVNLAHLEVVTAVENVRRSTVMDLRKLTADQVEEIRRNDKSMHALARQFGVDYRTVWNAKNGLTYREQTR